MSESETIVCKPTKWFLWRAIAMLVMFLVMAAWFVRDAKVGYPKKNAIYYTHKAFETAEDEFEKREKEGQNAAEWSSFVSEQKIPFSQEEGVLPEGVSSDQAWPEILGDYEIYSKAYELDGAKVIPTLWSDYSNEQGWDEKAPEKAYDAKTVGEQMLFASICGGLAIIAIFILMKTLSREMKADEEAFYAPGGERIPYKSIRRIDKRKWDSKGLASLSYESASGDEKKAKIDGMVYGQFHPENGAPAQALFDRVMANFSGELVELEREESEEKEDKEPDLSEG